MSKLEELIQQYCPDGVEYHPLWSLTAWDKKFNGIDKSKQKRVIKYSYLLAADLKSYQVDEGTIKLLTTNISNLYTSEERAGDIASEGEVVAIPWGGNPIVQYYKGRFLTADNRIATSLDTSNLNNKFLYYCMLSQMKLISSFYRGSGIKHPEMAKVLDLEIPVPPLPVQEEIVRILDTFTELQAELQAELQKRKLQYNYYLDNLLNFNRGGYQEEVRWMKMSDIAKLSRGRVISKDYLQNNAGIYPVYSSQTANNGELGQINTYDYNGNYLTWTTDGAYAGTIFKRKGCFSITNVCGLIALTSELVNLDYLYYWLKITAPSYVYKGMGNSKLMSNVMESILIPIIPLSEQQRIVSILDRFDRITNDLSAGLPAEIEKRRQQYDYYRDKLLTFKRKEA